MSSSSPSRRLLYRAGFALLGAVFVLCGTGMAVLGLRQIDVSIIGTLAGGVVGLALIAAGVRQVRGAFTGRVPRWYAEFVAFGGGVLTGGPPPADDAADRRRQDGA